MATNSPGEAAVANPLERSGRGRRIAAVILTLIQPAAGHFLIGQFRRGIGWVLGLAVAVFALLFVLPFNVITIMAALAIGGLARIACAIDAVRVAGTRPRWSRVLLGWAALIVFGLLMQRVGDYYRAHYAQAFTIPSGAMRETLLVGDYIMADRAVYRRNAPGRGDIVIFRYPVDERRDFVFRIVGMPGETVQLRSGQVVIDGRELPEPYVRQPAGSPSGCAYRYGCEPLVVPADSYFVLGDNRENANDSRFWGFVKREKIKGRAAEIYWSWDSDRHWLRWRRIGQRIS